MQRESESMKRIILNSKITAIIFIVAVMLFAVEHDARSALIDWAKHEEWRRKQLEALVAEVKLKGSAPYVIMSFREYDTNNDGVIDRNEIEAVKNVLSQPPATRPKK